MLASKQRDIRVALISKIWAYATGMMAFSILFSGPGRDWKVILLPATIVSSAAISTIAVCGKSGYRWHDVSLPSENVEELKQRIENLEAIAASSHMPWEHSLQQLDGATLDMTGENLSKPSRSDRFI